MIKPNDTVALILLLITVCAFIATLLMNRYLRPEKFLPTACSRSSSGSLSDYVDSSMSASQPRLVDPENGEEGRHEHDRIRIVPSMEGEVFFDGGLEEEDHDGVSVLGPGLSTSGVGSGQRVQLQSGTLMEDTV